MFLLILLFSISSLLNPTFCQEGEASNAYLIRANSNTCPKGVPERILQGINRFRFKNGLQGLGFSKETTAHSQLFTSQHLSHASWSLPEFGSFGRAAWLTSISPVPVNQQHKVEVNLAGAIDSLVAQCPPVMMVTERKFTEAEWASTRTMGVGCSSWTKPVVQRNVPSAVDFLVVIFFDKPQKMVVPQELKPSVDDNQQVISSSTEGTGVDKLDDGGFGTTVWGDEAEEEDESKVVLVTEVLGAAAAAATLASEMKHNLTTENLILTSTTQVADFGEVLTAEKLATEKLMSTVGETSEALTNEVFSTTKIFSTTEAQVNDNFFQYLTTAEELPVAIFPDSTEMSTVNESTSFLSESTNYSTTSATSTDLPLNSTTASFTTVLDANSSSSTVEASSTALPDDQTTTLFSLAESESTSVLDTDSSINQTESTAFQMTELQTSNSTTESLVTITEENSTTESETPIKDAPSTVDSVAVSDGNSSVESIVAITDGNSSVETVVTITANENFTTESEVSTTTDKNSTLETLEMINSDENSTTTTTISTQTPNITTETEQQLQHHLLTTALENSSTKLPIPTSSSTQTTNTTTATIPTTTTERNEATAVHLSPETTTLPPTKTTTAKITTTTESPNKTPEKTSTSSETPTSTNFPLHHHHHHHHVPCSPEYIHHLLNFFNQVRNYRHQRQLTLSAKLSKSANLLAQLPAEGIDLPFSSSFGTIVYHKRKDLLNNNSSSSSNNSTEAKCNFTDAVMAIYASRLRPMLKGGRPFSHEQWDQAAEVGVGCYIFDNEEAGRTELHVVFTFAIPKEAKGSF